jgi:hypothetical protein
MGLKISAEQIQEYADNRIKEWEEMEKKNELLTKARNASNPPEGMDMAYMLSSSRKPGDPQTSYWKYWFNHDDCLDIAAKVTNDKEPYYPEDRPRTFLVHGKGDTNCPWEDSDRYAKMINEKWGDDKVTTIYVDNVAHAFDYNLDFDDAQHKAWLLKLREDVEKAWWGPDYENCKYVKEKPKVAWK